MSSACDEGFICPYCLVGFGSASKLQGHFVEMHSDIDLPEAKSYKASQFETTNILIGRPTQFAIDKIGIPRVSDSVVDFVSQSRFESIHSSNSSRHGHSFKMVHHSRPKTCDSCNEIIWQDAIVCETCHVTLHTDKCEDNFTQPCSDSRDDSGGRANSREGVESRQNAPPQSTKGLLPFVRRQVAKPTDFNYPRTIVMGRERYVNEDFDLDLTYITERIIAMSFPATGMATAYRNNLKDVARMLQTKHEDNYMIFNLSERSYDITNFNNQVLDFGWPDHLAPSLERLSSVCKSIKSWLDSDPSHVAVVHCKGGKGRTGCVIAAFMHYTEICHSAEAALDRFAMKRFYDSKCGGVTQPSQRKYVHYFADLLAGRIDLQSPPVTLQHVIMHGIPNFDGKGGCRPFLKVYENMTLAYTSGLYLCQSDKERVKISIYGGLSLKGEVLIKCFHKKSHGMDPIFRCQFHSAVVGKNLRMVYTKSELDDAFKEKRFDDSIRVELLFDNGEDEEHNDTSFADVRSSLLEGKQTNNGSSNGAMEITNDPLAKRNSYASFRGGYDSGMPGEDAPDLINLDSPKVLKMSRDRSESTNSFQMDPNEIERFSHPQSSEVYTVIHRPAKEKPAKPDLKPNKSSSDIPNGSIFSLLDKTDKKTRENSPGNSAGNVASSNIKPKRPPPPGMKKPSLNQGGSRPTKPTPLRPPPPENDEDVLYEVVGDDISPGSISPEHVDGHRPIIQIKPTKQSPEHIPLAPQHYKATKPSNKPTPPSKPTVKHSQAKPAMASEDKSDVFQEELTKQLLKHHLKKKRDSVDPPQRKERKKTGSPKDGSPKHGARPNLRHRPSYAEVQPNLEIRVEPVSARTSAIDNDMWVRVKFPTMPPKSDSLGRRSSSSGNLTMNSNSGSDYYSNLAELDITPCAEGAQGMVERKDSMLHQRSHSFSGGDEKLIIKATQANRDSIIPVSMMAVDEPEYKNLEYGPDGTLLDSTELPTPSHPPPTHPPPSQPPPTSGASGVGDGGKPTVSDISQAKKDFLAKLLAGQHNYENTSLPAQGDGDIPVDGPTDEDYMNQLPEGLFHTYSNHDELLEQLRTAHQPIDDTLTDTVEESVSSETVPHRSRLGSGASILKFLNNLVRPKQHTIQSAKVSDEERVKTLAPFEISGVNIGHVNRDYEAFLRTSAWGDSSSTTSETKVPAPQTTNEPSQKSGAASDDKDPGPAHFHKEQVSERQGKDPSKRPPPKPERPKNLATSSSTDIKERTSPLVQRKFRRPILPSTPGSSRENQLSPPETPPSNRIPSPPAGRRHQPLSKKPSAPLSSREHSDLSHQPRSHLKLQATNSDAPIPSTRVKDLVKNHNRHSAVPALPPPRVRDDKAGIAGGEMHHHGHGRAKNPPPKPAPYFEKGGYQQKPSESTVKLLMPYWYRPNFTREEAIDFVRPLDPGLFIVRDSQTVQGGYALTLKISEDHVRRRKKLADDAAITEDMLVTHFLIQPDPEGVKLQGWNERAFKSLPEFIANHTVERLCMPCRLVLPQGSVQPQVRRKPAGVRQALQTGAACNLVYLGSVDVTSQGDDALLGQTVEQLRSLDLSSMNIVTFKASRDGVTLTDNVNGMYIRRQYPISSITYCGLDPNGTRWDFPSIQHAGEVLSLKDKPCFGIVYHPQDGFGYSCLVFAEFDSMQPVTSVVNFVQRVMKEHKHSSKHVQR